MVAMVGAGGGEDGGSRRCWMMLEMRRREESFCSLVGSLDGLRGPSPLPLAGVGRRGPVALWMPAASRWSQSKSVTKSRH